MFRRERGFGYGDGGWRRIRMGRTFEAVLVVERDVGRGV